MKREHGPARRGATLVELLVVLAIGVVLAALAAPAVQAAREAARRAGCGNRLRQLGLAAQHRHQAEGALPAGWDTWGTLWSARLLPYLEQQPLHSSLHFQESGWGNWSANGGPNERACGTRLEVFRCPGLPDFGLREDSGIPRRQPASYRGNAGSLASSDDASTIVIPGTLSLEALEQNGMFYACSRVRFRDVLDGLSFTILFGESRTAPDFLKDGNAMDHWILGSPQADPCRCDGGSAGTEFSEGVGATVAPLNLAVRRPAASGRLMEITFGSYHPGGAMFGLADGGVRYLAETIELSVLQALGGRDDGQSWAAAR